MTDQKAKQDDTQVQKNPSTSSGQGGEIKRKETEGSKEPPFDSAQSKKETKGEKRIKEAEEKAREWEEKYKRALADYHNLVKRVQTERAGWIQTANKELLLRLLPVLDTLILARKHSQDQTLAVTAQQFLDVLLAEGVKQMETVGRSFDPYMMEAIETVEGEEGKVVEEVRAGYTLHDTLLRPAQVRVGRKKE